MTMSPAVDIHHLPWCSRMPNTMADVGSFIAAYHDRDHAANLSPTTLRTTAAGSINEDGEEGSFSAVSLTPYHPQFLASLEPDTASLVVSLFNSGSVPYTSCEGHLLGEVVHEAHVGILCHDRLPTNYDSLLELQDLDFTLLQHRLWDPVLRAQFLTVEVYIARNLDQRYSAYRRHIRNLVARAGHALRRHCRSGA